MVVPRPALIAIAGAALVMVAFVMTRVAGQAEEELISTAPPPTASAGAGERPPAKPNGGERASRPGQPATKRRTAEDGLPADVARALARKQVVVLFFAQRGGSDDAATRESVEALRRLSRVAVFTAKVSELPDYRRVVDQLGITQAPATVVVGRDGSAQVVEGYVDAGSLTQLVRDAR